jgi:hypothetical protein
VRWSILIASHCSRVESLSRLADSLASQLQPGVEVLVLWNRGRLSIAEYREALVSDARGEWVSHVDDDDRVAKDFVSSILGALESEPDYVGFEVEVLDIAGAIGRKDRKWRAVHSLTTKQWHQKDNVFYRHVSHLNPLRRDLALQGVWSGPYSEDHRWADSVIAHVKTEVFIPRTLYFYDFNQAASVRSQKHDPRKALRPVLPDGFRYHPDSED